MAAIKAASWAFIFAMIFGFALHTLEYDQLVCRCMDAGAGRSSCRVGQAILGQPPGVLRLFPGTGCHETTSKRSGVLPWGGNQHLRHR